MSAKERSLRSSDVLGANRWFLYSRFHHGSGFFTTEEQAQNVFESLAEDNAFSNKTLIAWAKSMRRVDEQTEGQDDE